LRIDVDAHVDETEETWSRIADDEARFRPVTVAAGGRTWLWPGRTRPRHERSDEKTGTTEATRTLRDLDARVRRMDDLGIDVQVVYPTFFLTAPSDRSDVELALVHSYNRWMADATERTNGRMRWVVVPPYLSMDAALKEIAWAKEHGACGIFKHGTEQNRPASDPYFFPVYEAASALDMPICMHAGSGDPTNVSPINPRLHAISACLDLVGAGTPERFPQLRTGWIECGASWIPFVWQDIVARQRARSWGSSIRKIAGRTDIEIGPDLFPRFRFYSSCETTDDLDYILAFGTEDSLLLGTDYGHSDQSAEMRVHQVIEDRVEAGTLSADVARKLLGENARRFYGL
jgi:uncharacterized protein